MVNLPVRSKQFKEVLEPSKNCLSNFHSIEASKYPRLLPINLSSATRLRLQVTNLTTAPVLEYGRR